MAIVQSKCDVSTTSGTSRSMTFDSTPTAGNILLTAISLDKQSDAITTPSGWTAIGTHYNSASISGGLAYKVSDGTEGTVTWDWTTSVLERGMLLMEISSTLFFDQQASADSGASAVTSQSTGTTGTTTYSTGLAVAVWGADTLDNVDGTRAYTNGFSELYATLVGGYVGIIVATKTLSATGAVETTFSCTDTGDQMFGKIAVFTQAPAAADRYSRRAVITRVRAG